MCIAVSVKLQVCLEKRLVTAAGLQQIVQDIQMAGKQGHGQRLVAHAWTDPDFKTRLLRDGGAAAAELGISADGVSSKDGIKGTALPAVVCGWKPAAYLQLLPESRTKHCQHGNGGCMFYKSFMLGVSVADLHHHECMACAS